MPQNARQDAVAIWKAAVDAVDSQRLISRTLAVAGHTLTVADRQISLDDVDHIEVVGGGKAGAGMAKGVESAFDALHSHVTYSGWLNVPADCVTTLQNITLHDARPAGQNIPTQAGVDGTREILRRVSALGPRDLCLVLISGGGSALLPAPAPGISLGDKLAVTQLLAESGATIDELNAVRSRISGIKAGGLARTCTAGQLVCLIISDVIGDPIEVIASGPTCATPQDVDPVEILRKYDPALSRSPKSIVEHLQSVVGDPTPDRDICNRIVGNNHTALEAAKQTAECLGYDVMSLGSENSGLAHDLGPQLLKQLQGLRYKQSSGTRPVCLLAGGETTVQLCAQPGKGGRNQSVVLSALEAAPSVAAWHRLTLLSGGTDGEDGPTSSAGAIADSAILAEMIKQNLNPTTYLQANDAWTFFDQLDGLLNTGPTHTNVMDVAVGLVSPAR